MLIEDALFEKNNRENNKAVFAQMWIQDGRHEDYLNHIESVARAAIDDERKHSALERQRCFYRR